MRDVEQMDRWDGFYRTQGRAWRGVTDLRSLDIPAGSRVLEVGCGNGKTLSALREMGCEVVGMDFSEEAIKQCARLVPGIDVRQGDLLDMPFEDGSFDIVVMSHVLEHVLPEDMDRAVSEVGRVLVPGGLAYVRVFSMADMRSEKGERIDGCTMVRGNGIRYMYFTEDSLTEYLGPAHVESMRTVEERTRFGTVRSRIEAVLRF